MTFTSSHVKETIIDFQLLNVDMGTGLIWKSCKTFHRGQWNEICSTSEHGFLQLSGNGGYIPPRLRQTKGFAFTENLSDLVPNPFGGVNSPRFTLRSQIYPNSLDNFPLIHYPACRCVVLFVATVQLRLLQNIQSTRGGPNRRRRIYLVNRALFDFLLCCGVR